MSHHDMPSGNFTDLILARCPSGNVMYEPSSESAVSSVFGSSTGLLVFRARGCFTTGWVGKVGAFLSIEIGSSAGDSKEFGYHSVAFWTAFATSLPITVVARSVRTTCAFDAESKISPATSVINI